MRLTVVTATVLFAADSVKANVATLLGFGEIQGEWDGACYPVKPEVEVAGFKRLGEGAYRVAFRGPDGLVYKVARDVSYNEEEWDNYRWLSGKTYSPLVQLPRMMYHRGIVVMEYVPGAEPPDCYWTPDDEWNYCACGKSYRGRCWNEWAVKCIPDLGDLHQGNVRVTRRDRGWFTITPLDLGQ